MYTDEAATSRFVMVTQIVEGFHNSNFKIKVVK